MELPRHDEVGCRRSRLDHGFQIPSEQAALAADFSRMSATKGLFDLGCILSIQDLHFLDPDVKPQANFRIHEHAFCLQTHLWFEKQVTVFTQRMGGESRPWWRPGQQFFGATSLCTPQRVSCQSTHGLRAVLLCTFNFNNAKSPIHSLIQQSP